MWAKLIFLHNLLLVHGPTFSQRKTSNQYKLNLKNLLAKRLFILLISGLKALLLLLLTNGPITPMPISTN
ncbi:hypothetical protein AYR54_03660 [Loigolactobacillus backii]|nr:hypothetical protein AYR52_03650 [Loigolactobacillus backii]ANK64411.1 hypothetical protein AYR54_03660 [Loigolactobacillus backii]ANK67195.1 hypothetical protein AYR55_05380 [Loigolactobacillus backii]OLF69440.1 hypothetical protein ACX53_07985 [Loigolactobacillus backii]PIO87839.1 hypothetical protein B8A32_12135 [Loigolactobacillus backii]